jgi:hypothetical protein
MTSWTLTWGVELDEGPNESDKSSFPEENIAVTVYGGRPPIREAPHVWPKPRTPTRYGWGHGGSGV